MATRPQQRSTLQPENVDDNNHGQNDGGGRAERESDDIVDELSDEEVAALSQMRTGERDGTGEAEPDDEGDARDGGEDGDDGEDGSDGVDTGDDQAGAGERDQGTRDDGSQREQEQQKPRPKTINYGRHQRELAKREQRLAELEGLLNTERAERQKATDRVTRLDERTRMLLDAINAKPQAQQQQQEDQDPEPDKDQDPIAHLEWRNRRLEKQVQELSEGTTRDRQQRQQQTEEQREANEYTAALETAARANPDFADAFVHLRETRFTELGAIYAGIDVNDPEEVAKLSIEDQANLSRAIQASFAQEQSMVYREAKRTGRSVEQTIMRLAKARGFTPKQRQQQQQEQDDQREPKPAGGRRERVDDRFVQQEEGDGRRPQPPARRQQQERRSVSDEIDNIRAAAGASRSLSDAGGSPGGDIDLKRLVEMDDDEFVELFEKTSKNRFDRLMGK